MQAVSLAGVSDDAFLLFHVCAAFSYRHRTNGVLPGEYVARACRRLGLPAECIDELAPEEPEDEPIRAPWYKTGHGYVIEDYRYYCQPFDLGIRLPPGVFSDRVPAGARRYETPWDQLRREFDNARHWIAPIVFERDGFACRACGSPSNLTVDHIMPLALGGLNLMSNFQTLCRSCNGRKGARHPSFAWE